MFHAYIERFASCLIMEFDNIIFYVSSCQKQKSENTDADNERKAVYETATDSKFINNGRLCDAAIHIICKVQTRTRACTESIRTKI